MTRTGPRTPWRTRARRWAVRTDDFPLRRAVVSAVALLAVIMFVTLSTVSATANPHGGPRGPFGAFDVADSRGIRTSQYELSIDTGNVLNPVQLWLSMRLTAVWNVYRYGVAMVAYIFDWTLSMTWLAVIVEPLDAVARQIRDRLINPIGLASLMLLISGAVGGIRIVFGKLGHGIWDILSAVAVATAVSALLVSPVATVTGDPLTKVRNAGLGIAAMVDGGELPRSDINAAPDHDVLKPAPVLIDAFVRPAHGLINYGVNFTDNQKCTPAYDKALKEGPHFDPTAADQREEIGRCDPGLADYAEKLAPYIAGLGVGVFALTGLLVGATVLTGCTLLFVAVMMLGWSLLKLVVTGVIGIGPGDTRGPLIRDALSAVTSLVYVGVSTVVLAIFLVLIKKAFAADVGNPMIRFLLADVVLIAGLVIVIQTWVAHRRGAQSWAEKAMARFKQSTPKPTIGSRLTGWLKAPAGGEAARYGGLGGEGAGYGGAGSPMGIRRMVRPITHSNAFQLARLGVAAAATGGAGAVVAAKGTTRVAVATAHGAARGMRGARHTADSAQRIYNTYTAVRNGSRRASAGPTADHWIDHTLQARNWLHSHTAAAAAAASLHLGPTSQARPSGGPPAPPPSHHRPEDSARTADRVATEKRLTRTPTTTIAAATNDTTAARPAGGQFVVTVEPASTGAGRVQRMVNPVPRHRGRRPMRR